MFEPTLVIVAGANEKVSSANAGPLMLNVSPLSLSFIK